MLAEMAQEYRQIRETFAHASDISSQDLWKIAQQGPEARLNASSCTQPVLMAASIALWRIWCDVSRLRPIIAAGHSFGEYSALVVSGCCSFETGIRLAMKRGLLMESAISDTETAMAAVIGLDVSKISSLCEEISHPGHLVEIANLNSLDQTVVAGHAESVNALCSRSRAAGAKRCIVLPVSVAAHCQLMRPICEEMESFLRKQPFQIPNMLFVQNADAEAHSSLPKIISNLEKQLYSPVRWYEVMQRTASAGVEAHVECGFGTTLRGLNKRKGMPDIPCFSTDSPKKLEATLNALEA